MSSTERRIRMNVDPVDEKEERTGRTFYDFLSANFPIVAVLLLIVIGVVCIKIFNIDLSPAVEFLKTWYPILIAPVIGYIAGVIVVDKLIDVPCVSVRQLNPDDRTSRSWLIPLKLFMTFNQAGNGFELHDGAGRPVYYCESIDFENRSIVYSWPFSRPFYEVISDLDYYSKIVSDYNSLCVEVLHLRKHLSSIVLKQTRSTSKDLMDEILSIISSKDGGYDIFDDTIFESETDLEFSKDDDIPEEVIEAAAEGA